LTFDLLTLKSIGVFYSKRAITRWNLKALGQRVLELLRGNGFHSSGHCDLDLWPTDPKINRGLLLKKGYHPIKFEGSGSKGTQVIERKRSVTDRQTARRTDGQTNRQTDEQGKNNMSPPEGGDINTILNSSHKQHNWSCFVKYLCPKMPTLSGIVLKLLFIIFGSCNNMYLLIWEKWNS